MMIGRLIKSKLILIFSSVFLFNDLNYSQQFPDWFLDHQSVSCKDIAIGYAARTYYGDTSAIKNALFNAAESYVKNSEITISGDQSFWATAIGNAWMGSKHEEIYDTLKVQRIINELIVLDTCKLDDYLILLTSASDYDCIWEHNNYGSQRFKPSWINNLPADDFYTYAIGISEYYHHIENSWINAEKNARVALAQSLSTNVKAVQKLSTNENETIINESLYILMKDLEIISRWLDNNLKIFYILIRTPKIKVIKETG